MLALSAALLAQLPSLPSPGGGSDSLKTLVDAFLFLAGLGFVLGVAGHVVQSRKLVGIGVALLFLGTAVFLVAVAQEG